MGGGGDFWTSPITQTIIGSLGGLRVGPYQMVASGGGFRPFLPAQLYSAFKTQEEALKGLEGIIPAEMMPYVKYHTMLTGQLPSLSSIIPFISQKREAEGILELIKTKYGRQPNLPLELQLSLNQEIPVKASPYEQVMNWKPELTPPTTSQEGGKEGVATPTTLEPPKPLTPPRGQNKLKLDFTKLQNVSPLLSSIDINKFEQLIKKYPELAETFLKVADTTAKGDIIRNIAKNSGLSEENMKIIDMYVQAGDPENAMKVVTTVLGNKEVAKITDEIYKHALEGKASPPELFSKAIQVGLSPKIFDEVNNLVSKNLALQLVSNPKQIENLFDMFVKRFEPYINSKDKDVRSIARLYFNPEEIPAMKKLFIDTAQNILRTGKPEDLYNFAYNFFEDKFKNLNKATSEVFTLRKSFALQGGTQAKQETKMIENQLNQIMKEIRLYETAYPESARTYIAPALLQGDALVSQLPDNNPLKKVWYEVTEKYRTKATPTTPSTKPKSSLEMLYEIFKP
jgi:hypothetical protein